MKLDWKNSLLIALVFAVGLGLGAAVGLPAGISPESEAPAEGGVSVMLDYGDGTVETYSTSLAANENLFQVMERLTKENNLSFEYKEYEGLGTLIEKISDKKNGADDRYWQYWVNHQKPEVGASAYLLNPGDLVEWKFTPFKQE